MSVCISYSFCWHKLPAFFMHYLMEIFPIKQKNLPRRQVFPVPGISAVSAVSDGRVLWFFLAETYSCSDNLRLQWLQLPPMVEFHDIFSKKPTLHLINRRLSMPRERITRTYSARCVGFLIFCLRNSTLGRSPNLFCDVSNLAW